MSAEDELRNIAIQIANQHANRILTLEKKLLEIEAEKAKIQAQLDAANLANDRASDYRIMIGGDYACPSCAIERGREVPLKPIPGDNFVDKFRCRVCGFPVELPA